MKLLIATALLASPLLAHAQSTVFLDTQNGHVETLQLIPTPRMALGHGQLKSYWRIEPFLGLDASAQALSQQATVYGVGLFSTKAIEFNFEKIHWNPGISLVVGLAAQAEWRKTMGAGLYFGIQG
jgi:hypothetical protein